MSQHQHEKGSEWEELPASFRHDGTSPDDPALYVWDATIIDEFGKWRGYRTATRQEVEQRGWVPISQHQPGGYGVHRAYRAEEQLRTLQAAVRKHDSAEVELLKQKLADQEIVIQHYQESQIRMETEAKAEIALLRAKITFMQKET